MFFSFLLKKSIFPAKNSAALNNSGEKANLHRAKKKYMFVSDLLSF